jgi:prolyl-tRNA synthetase
LRLEIGPRDLKQGNAVLVRRDTGEKFIVAQSDLSSKIPDLLNDIQNSLFKKAQEFQSENTYLVSTYEEFKVGVEKNPGFYIAYFDGTPEDEEKIQEETKATGRCIPLGDQTEAGQCFYTGKSTSQKVIFAKAY